MNTPMQGLPNFLVYLYPMIQRAARSNPQLSCVVWLRKALSPSSDNNAPSSLQIPSSSPPTDVTSTNNVNQQPADPGPDESKQP
mmetsp:Transcript_24818/g.37722  ORF Transcript_24818/g.37722 Transcript_24818/m.37722 type:complete len:84 (+) Transcript_24818:88-339(+)